MASKLEFVKHVELKFENVGWWCLCVGFIRLVETYALVLPRVLVTLCEGVSIIVWSEWALWCIVASYWY